MRLKVEGDFLLLALIRQDRTHEQNETVRRDPIVELQALLRAGDSCKYRLPVHARLDIRRRTVLLRQHRRRSRDLILQVRSMSVIGR